MASRDERIETYYHQSAWELAESLVDAEDALKELNDEACRLADHTDATCVVLAERNRYKAAWRSARRRAKRNRSYADSDLRFTHNMWSDALRDLNRYRSAWLSARRRAADEANFGMEALALRDEVIRAQVDEMTRLRALVDEVTEVRGWCMAEDTYRSHLTPIYESLHELEESQRERRTFRSRWTRTGHEGLHDQCPNHDTIETAVQQPAPCTCDDERATVAYWKTELERAHEAQSRETTDAPRLEHMGTEEDGGTVWRLAVGPRIR
jgi:hypothetical protein